MKFCGLVTGEVTNRITSAKAATKALWGILRNTERKKEEYEV